MQSTENIPVQRGNLDPAIILLRAASALETGQLTWGREKFVDLADVDCRCLTGAIAWAADPADRDGDPRFVPASVRWAAMSALTAVADYVTTQLCWPWSITGGEFDLTETVGAWNDAQTSVAAVIRLLSVVASRNIAVGAAS